MNRKELRAERDRLNLSNEYLKSLVPSANLSKAEDLRKAIQAHLDSLDGRDSPQVSKQTKLALIFGNTYKKDYSRQTVLESCHNDAKAVTERLQELGYACSTFYEANFDKMQSEFKAFCARGNRDADGIIYFSGHGEYSPSQCRQYIVPVMKNKKDADKNGVMLLEWREKLDKLPGRHVFIMDCCRSEGEDDDDPTYKGQKAKLSFSPCSSSPSSYQEMSSKGLHQKGRKSVAQVYTLWGSDPLHSCYAGGPTELSVLTKALLKHLKRGTTLEDVARKTTQSVSRSGSTRCWSEHCLYTVFQF